MPKHHTPRHGTLQFYPRVRAKKIIPRVSWDAISKESAGLLGFIGYKVGMKSAYLRDNATHSLTKGQRITIPVTVIECPTMKIFSVRFYKNKKVIGEVLSSNIDKEMKKKVKLPKEVKKKIEDFKEEDYDNIRLIVYSQVKKTNIKKKPDIAEIGLAGTLSEKLEYVKQNMTKEISLKDVFTDGIVDLRGVSKGKGTQGPTKRFGLKLKFHKSEKGLRGPGSGGPWHPARVEYTQPMAGQMGYFTRMIANSKIIAIENIKDKNINPKQGFKKYGEIKTDYIIVRGSVVGPSKRQLLVTFALRPSKNQTKRDYEFIELR
ncbi:50S ribosomal protein L3 [Candidatus Pacearchaeota archaeon]|nr:50S ribosomal protein L3 [Candidatus Pacearchaeota archaeon]